MNRPARLLLAALLAVATVPVIIAGSASAATQVLTITPSTTRPTLQPGSSLSGSFQVINQGESGYRLHLYTAPYSVHTEDYTPDFEPLPGHPDVAGWLQLAPTQSTIKPDQSITVRYKITVPAGTQPGGYYAVAFAETQAPKNGQGVIVNERVGEIFYIQVAGTVRQTGKVLDWSSPFLQKSPLAASLRLENDGGIDYRSAINISVRDLFGHTKYDLATQKAVLPQTIRRIPITWDKAPAFGLFKVTGTVTVFGETQQLPTRYVLVAALPIRIIFLVLLVVLIAWLVGRFVVRRRSAKSVHSRKR